MINKNNNEKKLSGIGGFYTKKIATLLGVNYKVLLSKKSKNAPDYDFFKKSTEKILISQRIKYSLYAEKQNDVAAFLIEKKYYKGVRYRLGLPANGQRTHTNAQTTRKIKKFINKK